MFCKVYLTCSAKSCLLRPMTTTSSTFSLSIELGNEAMQDPFDVATALSKLAQDMSAANYPEEGIVRDANGNTVGRYTFSFSKEN